MPQIEITQVIEQIQEEIKVDELGRGKASIRATARLAGVDHTAIINHLQSGELKPTKLAERLTRQGFDAGELLTWRTNGIPDIAIAIIFEYYAFDAGRYCTKQAKLVCRAFNTIGVRAWMQDITGWTKPTQQHSNTQSQQPPTPALPLPEQRLHTLVQAMKTLAELTGGRLNPYTEQHFQDFVGNLLAEHNRKALTGTEEKWLGVVNFAENELGKNVPLKGSHYRGHLGTWVRTFYPQLGSRQETRLVNGTQQSVYVYPCHPGFLTSFAIAITKPLSGLDFERFRYSTNHSSM
ncbi:hypothetical protein [Nodularia sp. NIES-3585]|uniref:hypothetical protein n=1 Tax=Nodularia sp. NIES-3585 TaxID=1973477 RepID=UPI000B76079C|nr:hypothetical protein [Nodularia sp. NIES-3585]GAX38927.1 hypothetical protein NIES3585_49790 [Nodularia sp. NIES-3585]